MARRLVNVLALQLQPQPAASTCSLQQLVFRQFHALPTSSEKEQAQQQQLPASMRAAIVSQLPAGLRVLPPTTSKSFAHHQVRGMAGGGLDPTTAENTWLTYKSKYAEEKPNDLGQAMYAMILTFGFSWWLNDFMAYPPRVVTMLGVVFYVLYMRR